MWMNITKQFCAMQQRVKEDEWESRQGSIASSIFHHKFFISIPFPSLLRNFPSKWIAKGWKALESIGTWIKSLFLISRASSTIIKIWVKILWAYSLEIFHETYDARASLKSTFICFRERNRNGEPPRISSQFRLLFLRSRSSQHRGLNFPCLSLHSTLGFECASEIRRFVPVPYLRLYPWACVRRDKTFVDKEKKFSKRFQDPISCIAAVNTSWISCLCDVCNV